MKIAKMKKTTFGKLCFLVLMSFVLVAITPIEILADGDEVLGAPSIAIESGSGTVAAGTGMFTQPATIDINVPAGAVVKQVLLYWYGRGSEDGVNGDDTIVVDGNTVTGTLIGQSLGLPFPPSQAYRADITSLGLIGAGNNTITLSGLSFTFRNDGAGLFVIFDDGSGTSFIEIRDGHDFSMVGFTGALGVSVPQTFVFESTDETRNAKLDFFIGDAEASRPDGIDITVFGFTRQDRNFAIAGDGNEWDSLIAPIIVQGGANSVTVNVFSFNDATSAKPDSIAWIASALTMPLPSEVFAVRVTGGGVDSGDLWDGTSAKGRSQESDGINRYTFGGQAGAPTSSQPQPYGEWTHRQRSGPDGSFTFHAGTASAPAGTEIDLIIASDPGWCVQARKAPAKQIDFEGIGTFKNIKKPSPALVNIVSGETFHWFEVHIEDLGEPGKNGRQALPPETCPPEGSAGEPADCDCPDFYRITIYEAFDPQTQAPDMTNVIYEVYGYIRGGNLQIHPPIE